MDTILEQTESEEEPLPQNLTELTDPHQQFIYNRILSFINDYHAGKITREQMAFSITVRQLAAERRADRDGLLVKFLNKKGFPKALNREMEIIKRYNLTGSLLYLDVDQFKKFNDTFGHPEGDRLLKMYAGVIMRCTRASDLWGRIGGDELAVFLMGTDTEGAKIVAERIRQEIIQEVKMKFPNVPWEQTVSVGVSAVNKVNGEVQDRIEELTLRADQALYKAKGERNKVVVMPDDSKFETVAV